MLRNILIFYLILTSFFLHAESLILQQTLKQLPQEDVNRYYELADQLRCPTCTGLSILQSDAPFSIDIRQALLEQIREQKSSEDILQFFTERYGLWILRSPPKEGFHWLAWLSPLLVFVLGLFLLYRFKKNQAKSVSHRRSSEEILSCMQKELEDRRPVV